jgi:hypothetical protein
MITEKLIFVIIIYTKVLSSFSVEQVPLIADNFIFVLQTPRTSKINRFAVSEDSVSDIFTVYMKFQKWNLKSKQRSAKERETSWLNKNAFRAASNTEGSATLQLSGCSGDTGRVSTVGCAPSLIASLPLQIDFSPFRGTWAASPGGLVLCDVVTAANLWPTRRWAKCNSLEVWSRSSPQLRSKTQWTAYRYRD